MKDPEDFFTHDLPLLTQRLQQVQGVLDRGGQLTQQVERVQSHFNSARPENADLLKIALAISRAHEQLQVAITTWLRNGARPQ